MAANQRVVVQREAFDHAGELARLRDHAGDCGAVASFTGIVRSEAGTLKALTLEHYPGMTEAELTRIAEQATKRFAVEAITIIHRFGQLAPGDDIVLVLAASSHRADALAATDFIMDFLKTDAPFWKKVTTTSDQQSWVAAKHSDDARKARWQ